MGGFLLQSFTHVFLRMRKKRFFLTPRTRSSFFTHSTYLLLACTYVTSRTWFYPLPYCHFQVECCAQRYCPNTTTLQVLWHLVLLDVLASFAVGLHTNILYDTETSFFCFCFIFARSSAFLSSRGIKYKQLATKTKMQTASLLSLSSFSFSPCLSGLRSLSAFSLYLSSPPPSFASRSKLVCLSGQSWRSKRTRESEEELSPP